jgi:hypothetical protein
MRELTLCEVGFVGGGNAKDSVTGSFVDQDSGPASGNFGGQGSGRDGSDSMGRVREGIGEGLQNVGGDIIDSMPGRTAGYPEFLGSNTLVGRAIDGVSNFLRDSAAMINNAAPRPYGP